LTTSQTHNGFLAAAIVVLAALAASSCADPPSESIGVASAAGRSRVRGVEDRPVTFEDVLASARSGERRSPTRTGAWVEPNEINVPVGRIAVPDLGLDVAFRLGVHDAIVQLGPGLWPGTPFPGQPGNAVFAGHRTTHTHPFEDLDLLQRGDRIVTWVPGTGRTVFRVFRSAVVPEAVYADFVLRQPRADGARQITLFACTPKGQRTHRIVVRGRAPPVEQRGRQAQRRTGHRSRTTGEEQR
jgi:sortase A